MKKTVSLIVLYLVSQPCFCYETQDTIDRYNEIIYRQEQLKLQREMNENLKRIEAHERFREMQEYRERHRK